MLLAAALQAFLTSTAQIISLACLVLSPLPQYGAKYDGQLKAILFKKFSGALKIR